MYFWAASKKNMLLVLYLSTAPNKGYGWWVQKGLSVRKGSLGWTEGRRWCRSAMTRAQWPGPDPSDLPSHTCQQPWHSQGGGQGSERKLTELHTCIYASGLKHPCHPRETPEQEVLLLLHLLNIYNQIDTPTSWRPRKKKRKGKKKEKAKLSQQVLDQFFTAVSVHSFNPSHS